MGFFDFLKRKKIEEKVEIEQELSLEEIKSKISENKNAIEDNFKKLRIEIKPIITETISELKVCLLSLRSINLDKKRESEQLKGIVTENLYFYITHLEELIKNLENLDQTLNFNDYLLQVDYLFDDFSRKSAKRYDKATILIGKEFDEIKQVFKNFSRALNPIIAENVKNQEKIKKLARFIDNLKKISEAEKSEEQIKNIVQKLDIEKTRIASEIIQKEEEIKNMLSSRSYKNEQEEREKINNKLQELENELEDIQNNIDFKELARVYHTDEKKHQVIKKYTENFRKAIEDDRFSEFSKILIEQGLKFDLASINAKIKKLSMHLGQTEEKLKIAEEKLAKIKNDLIEIETAKNEDGKRLEKISEKKSDLIIALKFDAKNFFKNQ